MYKHELRCELMHHLLMIVAMNLSKIFKWNIQMELNTYVYLIKRAITFQNFPNNLYICYTIFFFCPRYLSNP